MIDDALLAALLVSAGAILVRSTCSLARMNYRTPHAIRFAAVFASVGSAGILLSIVMSPEVREAGVTLLAIGVALAATFGRRERSDHWRAASKDQEKAWNG